MLLDHRLISHTFCHATGPATAALIQAAALESADVVFEFGSGYSCTLQLSQHIVSLCHSGALCSSGGLAERLLSTVLHPQCMYHAVDQSPVQVRLAQQRLSKFGEYTRYLKQPFSAGSASLLPVFALAYLASSDIHPVSAWQGRSLCRQFNGR